MTSLRKHFLCAGLVLSLTACVSVLPDPEPANTVYRLTTDAPRVSPKDNAPTLRIDTPSAAKMISGRQIVVSPDAGRLAIAGGAEWADTLPALVQQSFLDILGARDDIVGLVPISGARSTYRIHLNIDNFEARFDNGEDSPPLIIVGYTATFAYSSTRNLIGTKQVTEMVRADSRNVSSIIASMNDANKNALGDIADWIGTMGLEN